ncbi:MAG: PEP-CTERM sorting domain-containing protein [Phycisphaeraceae bacterium]|nr:PEP-CTERM sorting domain-containing protein [Phycisphaeraceae bacterium]
MRTSNFRLSHFVTALLVLFFSAGALHATVLTYDIRFGTNNTTYWGNSYSLMTYFSPTNPSYPTTYYGDHASSAAVTVNPPDGSSTTWYNYGNAGEGYTPNIGVSYSADTSIFDTYDDIYWPRVAFLNSYGHYYITFTPDSGYTVQVNSFVLRSWGGSPPTLTADWTLWNNTAGGTVLASSKTDGQGQLGGTAQSFSFNKVSPPFSIATNAGYGAGTLVLDIHFTGGGAGNLSLDDVNFQQTAIPEPASLVLLALGTACVVRRGRGRSRR